jgi:hypothetical protein
MNIRNSHKQKNTASPLSQKVERNINIKSREEYKYKEVRCEGLHIVDAFV